MCINWRLNRPTSEWERAHMCKYQYRNGLTGRLGVGIPPVLDTISSSCSHNFILDRPVLSIVHNILAAAPLIVVEGLRRAGGQPSLINFCILFARIRTSSLSALHERAGEGYGKPHNFYQEQAWNCASPASSLVEIWSLA